LPPVRWLFAPDLIAYGKRIALHAFYGGELDPRDWMRVEDGHGHVEDASAAAGRERDLRIAAVEPPASGELWFDYLRRHRRRRRRDVHHGARLRRRPDDRRRRPCRERAPRSAGARSRWRRRRRGDAAARAVPVRRRRHRVPRRRHRHAGGPGAGAVRARRQGAGRGQQPHHAPRRLYGLPGNHDYYAELVGFNRMFRHGVTDDTRPGPGGRRPPLALPGYQRAQEASYLAIQLPWDWQLLGPRHRRLARRAPGVVLPVAAAGVPAHRRDAVAADRRRGRWSPTPRTATRWRGSGWRRCSTAARRRLAPAASICRATPTTTRATSRASPPRRTVGDRRRRRAVGPTAPAAYAGVVSGAAARSITRASAARDDAAPRALPAGRRCRGARSRGGCSSRGRSSTAGSRGSCRWC
jgi:hypothetical protein